MKRIICMLLLFALFLPGCGNHKIEDPANFYYRRPEPVYNGDDSIICPEQREVKGLRGNVDALVEAYFSGPVRDDLESPFPRETQLLSWSMVRSSLYIELNEAFAQLSGIDLTIACACITRTFLELTDATSVRISADGATLNGSSYIVMSDSRLNLTDDSIAKLRTELTLYYTDENRRYLLGQAISVSMSSQSETVAYLVDQLTKPPKDMGLVSPLPSGTRLLSSTVENGVCTLNFSTEFENNAFSQSYAQRTTLLSLVNTLTQLDGVEQVEFCVEGGLLAQYRQLNISKALSFDESIIGPVRTGVNEFDATLYLSNGSELYLVAVPTRIRQSIGLSQAEMVVEQLIQYENQNGFFTTIPSATTINSLSIEDGLCSIDLSRDFLGSGDDLELSVRSIVTSVCSLEGITSVRITIDAETPQGDHAALFDTLTPDPDWYL